MSHKINDTIYEQLTNWLRERSVSAGDIIQDEHGWYINEYEEAEDCTINWHKRYLPANFQELV